MDRTETDILAEEVEKLRAVLEAWLKDVRALQAVAPDCTANLGGNCVCLYCRSLRVLSGW